MKHTFIYASLAAALTLTAACGTNTGGEPVAAPSRSASASPSTPTSAADAAASAGLPDTGSLDLEDAAAAAAAQQPFVFGTGRGCGWLRLPDRSLYALHDNGTGSAALTRDRGIEAAFRADPSYEPGTCRVATGLPTADDPAAEEPYRWVGAYGNQFLRWGGRTYIIPGTVGVGLVLRPIASEVIPGVDGVPIPPPAQTPN